jgi:uncharacterized membrane protein
MLEGVDRAAFSQELARRTVMARSSGAGSISVVAVYEGGQANTGILGVMEPKKSTPTATAPAAYTVVSIPSLEPQFWREAKVLFLPQLRDTAELTPQIVDVIRNWVAAGGTLILTHDAVGFRWHLRMFPEIGAGAALSKKQDVTVEPNALGISAGEWTHEYPDHVIITPGKDGKVLAHETGDENKPVLVAGNFGKGKVFLYGGLLGYAPDGTLDDESKLILEMIQ